ncbi:MAG: TetR/AcrR family transcriptional regulator [Lachnospiraceae bacterium]
MPPKQRITPKMVLQAGYDIARKKGIENVNSRNISKLLSCSTQPVFSCFSTMEELRKGVFDFACNKLVSDGMEYVNSKNPLNFLSLSIQWYLKLLRNEPYLYKLLYFSNNYWQGNQNDFIVRYTSNNMVLSKMQTQYILNQDICKDILIRCNALLHGIGTLVFFNNFEITDKEIEDMVIRTVSDMVLIAQKKTIKEVI